MAARKKRGDRHEPDAAGKPSGPAGGRSAPQDAVGPAGEFDPLRAAGGAVGDGGPREELPAESEPAPAPAPAGAAPAGADAGTAARLAALEADLEAARAERDDLRDRWFRLAAELDNVRKRTRRELEEARLYALSELLRDLLEVLDNFGLALDATGPQAEVTSDVEALRAGVTLIRQRLHDVLSRQGLQEIPALGEVFDPAVHEAVGQIEVEGVPSGQVVEVLRSGFRLHDRVLRPSRVIVAR